MASPTARSLEHLRRLGYAAGVVERWIAQVGRRRDLFGIIDLVAVKRGESGVLGIQATSAANISARLAKARARPELHGWLAAGNKFEVWGWLQRNGRWTVKRVAVDGASLEPITLQAPPRRRREGRQGLLFAANDTPVSASPGPARGPAKPNGRQR